MLTLNYPINDTFEVFGEKYKVNMAFDNVMRYFDLLEDKELQDAEKVLLGINVLLGVSFLSDFGKTYEIFNTLHNTFFGPEESSVKLDRAGNPLPVQKKENEEEKVYSLKHDAEYIYASFRQAYGMDLLDEKGKLHWFKFKALLAGLPEDTKFSQVVDIRTRELPKGRHSSEEKKALKKLKELYALPEDEDEGE